MKVYDLNILPKLISNKPYLLIDDIPAPFQKDLKTFLIGETFMPNSKGELRIGKNLYRSWLDKLFSKGFDYDVDLKIK